MRLKPMVAVPLALAAFLAACSSAPVPPAASSPASAAAPDSPSTASRSVYPDWPTYHGDLARTGVAVTMPAASGTPVVQAALTLDGAVYASPIVVAGLIIVATEQDSVFGLDRSGLQVWRTRLGSPAPMSQVPCGNIDPLGITGTPVYDSTTKLVYLVAEHDRPPRHELVALHPDDGSVAWRASVDLPGVDAAAMQQRGALAVTGTTVWVPFGGLEGDCGAYKGRLVGVPLTGEHLPVAFTVPTSRGGGIWAPPGPSVDSVGHVFVSVGNGASVTGDPYDHSDSVLRLDGTGIVDSFSPSSWRGDNERDLDLGSQGPALVGSRWIFIAGKSGTAYVLRQGHLGGVGGQVSSMDVCPSFGGTAVAGDVVYVPCTDGLRAVRIRSDATIQVQWHAAEEVTGSPVVGGGRVWVLDPSAGVLHALDPSTGESVAQVAVGVTSRFATPAISGPYLLVPTMTGVVVVRTSSGSAAVTP